MNVCVIGLGSMGKRRIRLLKQFFHELKIIGIDNNLERMKSVSTEYKVDCYLALSEFGEKADCAFVCTSPQFHASIIKECLERNLHVFSEINLIDKLYDENIRLAEQKGKTLFLSSTPLYKDEIQLIRSKVKQNGRPCAYQYHVGQYLPDWHPWDKLDKFFISNKSTNGCRELLAIELPWIQSVFGRIKAVKTTKTNLTDLKIDFYDKEDVFMARGGFPGGFGGGNMNNLMKQAQKLQRDMEQAQKELETKEFEASVGGGAVVVKVNGKKEVLAINIKEEVVDPDDVEMLEDLVLSAVNEALKKAEDETANKMGKLTGGMNIPGLF